MGFHNLVLCFFPLLASLLAQILASDNMYPMYCSLTELSCNSLLYHINNGLEPEQVASFYNVSASSLTPIHRGDRQDYLVSVVSSCKNINGTIGYFYDVPYLVKQNDTFFNVSTEIYSGQVWEVGDEEEQFIAGNVVSLNLLTGCLESDSQIVGTYTVEQSDSISDIATRLSSTVNGIQSLNSVLIRNPNFLVVGWVLFVPMAVAPAPM